MTPETRAKALRTTHWGIAILVLLWAALTTVYFLRSNGALLPGPGRPLGIFQGLIGNYTFSLRNSPPLEVLQALVALGLTQLCGLLWMRAFGLREKGLCFYAMAFVVGFGISGIAFELLTMARLLYPVTSWLLWIALIAAPWWWIARITKPREILEQTFPCLQLRPPKTELPRGEFIVWCAGIAIVVVITLLTFWHAVFYPETYWDSLILYLGYARMTFLEHAFPFKAEAQVGIGLGANYPHIYSTFGAMASMLFNHWSDMPQRLAAPIAGAFSCILIYGAAWEIWRDRMVALATLMVFRAVPHGITYTTYASDYAFAILLTAAFVYTACAYARRPGWPWLIVFTSIPSIGMHLNYLMGILWVPWAVQVLAVQTIETRSLQRAIRFTLSRAFLILFGIWLALSSTWYIRNYVLTGNPVYAFFPEIFTGSVRMNTEVLRSAELEWFRVGDGIGVLAENLRGIETNENVDFSAPDFERQIGLSDRLRWSFLYWVGFDVASFRGDTLQIGSWPARLHHLLKLTSLDPPQVEEPAAYSVLRWRHAYKYAPLMSVYFFPALLLGAALLIGAASLKRNDWTIVVSAGNAVLVSVLLLLFMYLLADFYSYQIIGIVASGAVTASLLFGFLRLEGRFGRAPLHGAIALVFVASIFPGVAFALMNFKFSGARVVYGQPYSQTALDAFRNPGIPASIFYRMQFGSDPDMWDYVNENLVGERLLTHENRHYVYDPSITLVHLDDWDMQQGYGIADPTALLQFLHDHDIQYYLRIPNEVNHRINRELGMDTLNEAGLMELIHQAGDNRLYRLKTETLSP